MTPFMARAAYVSPGSAIDNVQNYSSSPFYSTDGSYAQRFPTPVYAKGPQLNAAECISVVNSAIWTQCSFRNNCAGATLSDIRPGVILELSNRTDNNYATACAGYIDELFQQYKQQAAGAVGPVNFPTAGRPANYGMSAQPVNPLSYYDQMPQWEVDQEIRKGQLRTLQAQNAATKTTVIIMLTIFFIVFIISNYSLKDCHPGFCVIFRFFLNSSFLIGHRYIFSAKMAGTSEISCGICHKSLCNGESL